MGKRLERHVATALEEGAQGWVARKVAAQDDLVHEHSDDALELAALAVGHVGPNRDVGGTGVRVQERLDQGDQRREQRASVAPTEVCEPVGHLAREHPRDARTARRGRAGRGGVDAECQRTHARQLRAPVGHVFIHRGAVLARALPAGVVRVGDRERRQHRRASLAPRRVHLDDVAGDDPQRPAVGDEMVHRQQERVVVGREPQEPRAGERCAGDVERHRALFPREPGDRVVARRHRTTGGVLDAQRHARVRSHGLERPSVNLLEARAQRRVARHHVVEAGRERRAVERAAQPERNGDVVRRAPGLDLLHEPDAELPGHQRCGRIARRVRNRFERLARGAGHRRVAQRGRHAGDGRRFEDQPERKRDAELVSHPHHQPGAQQRVAAEVEEVVLGADVLDPEQRRPNPGESVLERRAGVCDRAGIRDRLRRQDRRRHGRPFGAGLRSELERVRWLESSSARARRDTRGAPRGGGARPGRMRSHASAWPRVHRAAAAPRTWRYADPGASAAGSDAKTSGPRSPPRWNSAVSARPGPTSRHTARGYRSRRTATPSAKRTGARSWRAQYAGLATSSAAIHPPVVQETNGISGARALTPRTTDSKASAARSIMGE